MMKKALLIVTTAGALSVPLAGVAWAEPTEPGAPSEPAGVGIGAGGVPVKSAEVYEDLGAQTDGHVPPGTGDEPSVFGNSDLAKLPGSIRDIAEGAGLRSPGEALVRITPACVNGSLGCL